MERSDQRDLQRLAKRVGQRGERREGRRRGRHHPPTPALSGGIGRCSLTHDVSAPRPTLCASASPGSTRGSAAGLTSSAVSFPLRLFEGVLPLLERGGVADDARRLESRRISAQLMLSPRLGRGVGAGRQHLAPGRSRCRSSRGSHPALVALGNLRPDGPARRATDLC